jgi:acyl-coenzyme A thioesterase PaaI-like protein
MGITMDPSTERRIAELESAGWKRRNAGPFMNTIGPLWARKEQEFWTYGLVAQSHHLNPAKVVHGGLLQSLIDHALSAIAWEALGRTPCMTVQTDSQFLSSAKCDDFIVAHGMETHRTKNLVFMRGHLEVNGSRILSAQSIFKIAAGVSAGSSPWTRGRSTSA